MPVKGKSQSEPSIQSLCAGDSAHRQPSGTMDLSGFADEYIWSTAAESDMQLTRTIRKGKSSFH